MRKVKLFLSAVCYLFSVVRPIRDFLAGSEQAKKDAVERQLVRSAREIKAKYSSFSGYDVVEGGKLDEED